MRSWAHSVANTARVRGSQMIGLRYRTYASPGATVDVLLPEGRRVKAVIGPDPDRRHAQCAHGEL